MVATTSKSYWGKWLAFFFHYSLTWNFYMKKFMMCSTISPWSFLCYVIELFLSPCNNIVNLISAYSIWVLSIYVEID